MRSGESDQEQSKKQKTAHKALSFEKLAASEQASTSDSVSPYSKKPVNMSIMFCRVTI